VAVGLSYRQIQPLTPKAGSWFNILHSPPLWRKCLSPQTLDLALPGMITRRTTEENDSRPRFAARNFS
jgi:hypothetical protein